MESTAPIDLETVVSHDSTTGEKIEVSQQLQFYTRNSLLVHPLVSPAMSYLGGLPPLMFIAGDKEVLRDEIIYTFVVLFVCSFIASLNNFIQRS